MKNKQFLTLVLLFSVTFFSPEAFAQKVGLVMSGGGGRGMAHIGVIKALEENNIPIDYITGTSAGALIGGYYAAGYTPEEILQTALTNTSKWLAPGAILTKEEFYFKKNEPDGTFINLPLSFRGIKRALPENLMSDFEINVGLAQALSSASAAAGNNFDSLFVPYRAMASDVFQKKAIPLGSGSLPFAVRASIAVPVFYPPASNAEYHSLYDGGVYDNFPVKPMQEIFKPDFIIGVYVNGDPNTKEEVVAKGGFLMELIGNSMIDQESDSKMPEKSVLIKPDIKGISPTDFNNTEIAEAYKRGYDAAILAMPEIKKAVARQVSQTEREAKRLAFKQKEPFLLLDSIKIVGAGEFQSRYIRNTMGIKPGKFTYDDLRKGYFRLRADGKFTGMFPELRYNEFAKAYDLHLYVKPTPRFNVRFGGVFFTPTDHQLQAGFRYQGVSVVGYELDADLSRGSFTNHARFRGRLDIPTKKPFIFETEVNLMQWDLQRLTISFANVDKLANCTFNSLEIKPSFSLPVTSRSKLTVGYAFQDMTDSYFNREKVLTTDTLDRTNYVGSSVFLLFQKNSLNKKQYATKGSRAYFSVMYNEGTETYLPGTYDQSRESHFHRWLQARAYYNAYLPLGSRFSIGWMVEGAFSSLGPYSNPTATLLSSPKFLPLQDSPILYLPKLYSKFYGAGGLHFSYAILTKLYAHLKGSYMQSFKTVAVNDQNLVVESYSLSYKNSLISASAGLTFDTPIGPIGAFFNYYNNAVKENSFRVMIHIGYMIFNKHPWH